MAKVKYKWLIILMIGVGLGSLLIFYNREAFIKTTDRLLQILDIDNLKNFFEIYNDNSKVIFDESIKEIEGALNDAVDHITTQINKPFGEILLDLLSTLLDFVFNFIIYFCNYGVTIIILFMIFFKETIGGEEEKTRTTPLAKAYIELNKGIDFIIIQIKKLIKHILHLFYKYRLALFMCFMFYIATNGVLYSILTETLIFLITYVVKMINLEVYKLVFSIIQSMFLFVYPKLKFIPYQLFIPIALILVFVAARNKGLKRLRKNHKKLKTFAKDSLTQTTFINGAPGTGKTLLNVSLSLASEENYVDELEKIMLDYEMNHKYLNFGEIRKNQEKYPEHKDYLKAYNLLSKRGTFLISNYAIYSPYFYEYSKIFNFEYMKVNKKAKYYPLEEYIVISLSEFDKEYNSHDNKKEVGADGAATFFSTVSHSLERHCKIFVDYQLKDQVPLRIRGNSENFITVKKRLKKYPMLLGLYFYPLKGVYLGLRALVSKYEITREKRRTITARRSNPRFKRNDITLIYIILRHITYGLNKAINWFNKFYYFVLVSLVSDDEGLQRNKTKLPINIVDLSCKNQKIYDSTFLSFAYQEKKNKDFKDLDRFTSLKPSIDELDKCNSRFYNNINQQ